MILKCFKSYQFIDEKNNAQILISYCQWYVAYENLHIILIVKQIYWLNTDHDQSCYGLELPIHECFNDFLFILCIAKQYNIDYIWLPGCSLCVCLDVITTNSLYTRKMNELWLPRLLKVSLILFSPRDKAKLVTCNMLRYHVKVEGVDVWSCQISHKKWPKTVSRYCIYIWQRQRWHK